MPSSWSHRLRNEDQLWFPGLTDEFVADFVLRNQVDPGLIDQYGTARWLARNADQLAAGAGDIQFGSRVAKIEYLPSQTAAMFEGLNFVEYYDSKIHEQIQAGADVLMHIPTLAKSVGSLVKAIHPLQALRDHDVSHSTPELPFSIFVSIPAIDERDASLRVAESLIHEAMHLQLTLVDLNAPLVADDRANGYSPWKEEVRPFIGLLHGLYVFAVIHQAFEVLASVRDDWRPYCRKRNNAIEIEVRSLHEQPNGLSALGGDLWRRCRESIAACSDGGL